MDTDFQGSLLHSMLWMAKSLYLFLQPVNQAFRDLMHIISLLLGMCHSPTHHSSFRAHSLFTGLSLGGRLPGRPVAGSSCVVQPGPKPRVLFLKIYHIMAWFPTKVLTPGNKANALMVEHEFQIKLCKGLKFSPFKSGGRVGSFFANRFIGLIILHMQKNHCHRVNMLAVRVFYD